MKSIWLSSEMKTEIKYLTQRVIPNIGTTDVVQEEAVAAGLKEFNSINFISGYEAGFITGLEKKNLKESYIRLAVSSIKMNFHLDLFLNSLIELQEALLLLLVL